MLDITKYLTDNLVSEVVKGLPKRSLVLVNRFQRSPEETDNAVIYLFTENPVIKCTVGKHKIFPYIGYSVKYYYMWGNKEVEIYLPVEITIV